MKTRTIAVGIIHNNKDEILICKMAENRGAYVGQWGILGGGMDSGEKIGEALKREAREELGITLKNETPFTFHDDLRNKHFPDGHTEETYMVFCIFDCEYEGGAISLNDEWDEYAWVKPEDLMNYDFNEPTIKTFKLKGWL